jgi:hypothetical protein
VRRRIQQSVDRRFNRRRHDAGKTIAAFSVRLRHEVDLDAVTGELVGAVEQTVEPTKVWLWLRESSVPRARRSGGPEEPSRRAVNVPPDVVVGRINASG